MLEQQDGKHEQGLPRKDINWLLGLIKAVQEDEFVEMTNDFVLGTPDEYLTWASSQHLTKAGQPFYFTCYARPKALQKTSASERLLGLLDEKQILLERARPGKELKLKELEYRHGCYDIQDVRRILPTMALYENKWLFEV